MTKALLVVALAILHACASVGSVVQAGRLFDRADLNALLAEVRSGVAH